MFYFITKSIRGSEVQALNWKYKIFKLASLTDIYDENEHYDTFMMIFHSSVLLPRYRKLDLLTLTFICSV